MNNLKIPFIAICLLMLSATTVMAATQGLLLLGTSRQSVDLSYDFTRNSFSKRSSQEQNIIENYSFGIDYAVLNPDVMNGALDISLYANQFKASGNATTSSSNSKLGFLYNIKGNFFDKSIAPVNLLYRSQISDVQRAFGASYKLNSDIFSANWTVRNRIVPLAFSYSHSVSSTDGTADDRTSTNDEIDIHAGHTKGISQTYLDLTNRNERTVFHSGLNNLDDHTYSANIRNSLLWNDAGRSRSLYSALRFNESTGGNAFSSFDWQENLSWDLGKSLKTGINYTFSTTRTNRGKQDSSVVNWQLQHTLFQSLVTQLQANARKFNDNNGTETEIDGRLSLLYKKALLAQSLLQLQGYRQYGVTERTQGILRRTALNEPHTASIGQAIPLNNPNIVPGSVVIYNSNPAIRPSGVAYTTFDFTVDMSSSIARIVVTPLSQLETDIATAGGNNLLITYDYQLDRNLRFATVSQGAGADLGLLGDKYRLFVRVDQTSQEPLGGKASSLQLNSQTMLNAGVNAKWNKYTLTTQYTQNDSIYDSSRSLDGSLDYADILGNSTLALYVRNSYRWYGKSQGRRQDPENILSMGGNYVRPSFLYGTLALRADYGKWTSRVQSDRFSVGADIRWMFRKFVVTLQSNLSYTRTNGNLSESESVRLHLIRYF